MVLRGYGVPVLSDGLTEPVPVPPIKESAYTGRYEQGREKYNCWSEPVRSGHYTGNSDY